MHGLAFGQGFIHHIINDGHLLRKQVYHKAKIDAAGAALVHDAGGALGIDFDVREAHEAAGVFDGYQATVDGVDGILVRAVFFQGFQCGVDDFHLLAHGDAKGLSVVTLGAYRDDGGRHHFHWVVGFLCCRFRLLSRGGLRVCLPVALGCQQLIGQGNGPPGQGRLQLAHHGFGFKGGHLPTAHVDFLDQGFHHVHHQQEQIDELMAGGDFALPHVVEQCFGLVGQGIELVVADDAAVALHIVEEAEEVVDQICFAGGVFFQFQEAVIQIFNNF